MDKDSSVQGVWEAPETTLLPVGLVADNRRPSGRHMWASWPTVISQLADDYRPPIGPATTKK